MCPSSGLASADGSEDTTGGAAEPCLPPPTDPAYLVRLLAAVGFTEANLHRDITVEDMAGTAGLSPFYFTRVFNEATGHSPYDYLVRRRLSEAVTEVMPPSTASMGCIARRHGFGSAETFSRAFRRMYGLLPTTARSTGELPRFRMRARITIEYMRLVNGLRMRQAAPVRVEFGELSLVGREVHSLNWPSPAAVAALARRSPVKANGSSYAVIDWHRGGFTLFFGADSVADAGPASCPHLAHRQVPAQEYLSLHCRPGGWRDVAEAIAYVS